MGEIATSARADGRLGDAVADAVLRCIARWGLAKTTLEDVAREAGISRATLYRSLPGGGKDALLAAVAERELTRLEHVVGAAVDATDTLEDALVAAVTTVSRHLAGHVAFQALLAHEPGLVLPHLAFHELDLLLARVRAVGGPMLGRFLDDADAAAELAEWVARVVISYTSCPAPGTDLGDDASVRWLVRAFVLPHLLTTA